MSSEECMGCGDFKGGQCTSTSLKSCILRRTLEKTRKDDEVKICYVTEEDDRMLKQLTEQQQTMGLLPRFGIDSYEAALCKALGVVILPESARKIVENEIEPREPTIPELKKLLKHCMNHMQRIALEKKLNEAYRKQKKKRRRGLDGV